MGVNPDKKKQSWNDSFQEFMNADSTEKKIWPEKRQKTQEAEVKVEAEGKAADETKADAAEGAKGAEPKKDEKEEKAEDNLETTRLYVMNLSFKVTHDELKKHFVPFGEIINIEIPLRKGGKGKGLGIAYVSYKDTEGAISSFA